MARVEVDARLHHNGLLPLLQADESRQKVVDAGERVKAAVDARAVLVEWGNGKEPRRPIPCEVRVDNDEDRTRVRVGLMHPAGLRTEIKYHVLAQAIDAAR